MKRKLLSLFALLLSLLMLVLPLASCDNSGDDDDDDEKGGGKGDTTPVASVVDEMFLATLSKEDIKIDISMNATTNGPDVITTQAITGTIYAIKTNGVYDIKADLEVTQKLESPDGSHPTETETYDVVAVIKDGNAYTMLSANGEKESKIDALEFELNLEDLLEQLIVMYNEELKEVVGIEINNKEDVASLLGRVVATITTGMDLGLEDAGDSYKLEYSIDMKDEITEVYSILENAKNRELVEVVLDVAKVYGVKLTKAQVIELIDETFVAGLDLTQAIAKVENALETITGEKVSFKEYFDKAQENSGLTTEQIVGYIKLAVDDPSMFTAPNAGETIYSYLLRKFGGAISVDDLIASELGEGATLANIGEEIKALVNSGMTVQEFIVAMEGTDSSELQQTIDAVFAYIAELTVDDYKLDYVTKLNKDYTLKEISLDEKIKVNGGELQLDNVIAYTINTSANVSIKFDYANLDSSVLDLPTDFYDYYAPMKTIENNLRNYGYDVTVNSEGNAEQGIVSTVTGMCDIDDVVMAAEFETEYLAESYYNENLSNMAMDGFYMGINGKIVVVSSTNYGLEVAMR